MAHYKLRSKAISVWISGNFYEWLFKKNTPGRLLLFRNHYLDLKTVIVEPLDNIHLNRNGKKFSLEAFPGATKIFTLKALNSFYESDSNTLVLVLPYLMLIWIGVMVTIETILSETIYYRNNYFPRVKKDTFNVNSISRLIQPYFCTFQIVEAFSASVVTLLHAIKIPIKCVSDNCNWFFLQKYKWTLPIAEKSWPSVWIFIIWLKVV